MSRARAAVALGRASWSTAAGSAPQRWSASKGCASPHRCGLLDAAGTEPPEVVAAAVREAEYLRLVDLRVLAAVTGRPGAATLRELARDVLPVRGELREELERRFAEFLRARRFAVADVNRGFRLRSPAQKVVLDVVWREAGLAVELDGRRAHDTARAFEADRLRDRRVAVQLGLQVVRVTWRQLHDEPDALADDLASLYARGVAARTAGGARQSAGQARRPGTP